MSETFRPESVKQFRYVGHDFDHVTNRLVCRYALDDLPFEEVITFRPSADARPDLDAADAAARLVFLLAGISYYKAAAPLEIVVEHGGLTPAERSLLDAFYRDGLGEYCFRNDLSIEGLTIVAEDRAPLASVPSGAAPRALIPFGGGLDSIVTVEGVRDNVPDISLFVVSREGDTFDAIETAIEVTGLPVVRAERRLDDKILRSREFGYRNGHVPVTGVISAIAVTAAILDGRNAVVMSNEWSAASGNTVHNGRVVNHQWSKTLEFEDLFRAALAESVPAQMGYFSWLRPFSELWVASRFEHLSTYWQKFRSCNRAFHIDPAERLDHWCGVCDKCAFIDLIVSPYVPRSELVEVFDGNEPLANPDMVDKFRTLLGLSGDIKPFECVGDVDECRIAVLLADQRDDRSGEDAEGSLLRALADEVRAVVEGDPADYEARLHRPLGPHRIPDTYAPADLLG